MKNLKPELVGLSWLQICLLPILYLWTAGIRWSVAVVATLLFALALAGARSRVKLMWWLTAAAVFGVIAASSQWLLLPVILAQVGYSALVNSQNLSKPMDVTLWSISVFFAQIVLLYQLMQGLTLPLLGLLAVLLVPQIISVWADHLPLWAGLALLVLVAVAGFFTGQLTWLAAGTLVLVAAGTSTRVMKADGWLQALAAVIISAIFILSRLHG